MLDSILIPASVLLAGIAATIIARAAFDDLIRAVRWDRHLRGVPGLDDRLIAHRQIRPWGLAPEDCPTGPEDDDDFMNGLR